MSLFKVQIGIGLTIISDTQYVETATISKAIAVAHKHWEGVFSDMEIVSAEQLTSDDVLREQPSK